MKKSLLLASSVLLASSANAAQIWSDFSISVVEGDHYKAGGAERTYVTLEHVSGHTWGDTFLFIDRGSYKQAGTRTETYMEFSPRLSLSKLTGANLSFGPVTDVYLAATWEANTTDNPYSDSFNNYLVGVGVDLKVPNFAFFKAAYYKAYNDGKTNKFAHSGVKQNDTMWHASFKLPITKNIVWDGFLDYTPEKNSVRSETNLTTQLKYNVGSMFGAKKPVYVGVEHSHWNNKFSLAQDQRDTSLLVKWHF